MKHSANQIRKLVKHPKNHATLLSQNVWDTIIVFKEQNHDLESNYFALCAMIDLSVTHENPAEDLIEVIDRIDAFTHNERTLEDLQAIIAKRGKFRYFKSLLDSPFVVNLMKEKLLNSMLKILSAERVLERFVKEHMVSFITQYVKSQSELSVQRLDAMHYPLCVILSKILDLDKPYLDTFMKEGGLESLIYFATKSKDVKTTYIGLHSLVDLSIKSSAISAQLQSLGIKPILLASRSFCPAPANFKDEQVYQHLRRSFQRGVAKFGAGNNNSLTKQQKSSATPRASDKVLTKLWKLIKDQKDLTKLSTNSIRLELEAELSNELKEQEKTIRSQINALIGQIEKPTLITEHIYIGSEWNSSNKEELEKLGITHILNLSSESPNYFPKTIGYYNISLTKAELLNDDNIDRYFEEASQFIEKVVKENGKVLIHSQLGQNRATAFVIAYIMKAMNYHLLQAFKFVKDKRDFTNPSKEYMYQLRQFEYVVFWREKN